MSRTWRNSNAFIGGLGAKAVEIFGPVVIKEILDRAIDSTIDTGPPQAAAAPAPMPKCPEQPVSDLAEEILEARFVDYMTERKHRCRHSDS